ncbi:MAG: META domain-containing protein [Acidimicrobiales bacterium]
MRRLLALAVLCLVVAAACGDEVDSVTTDDPGDDAGTRPSVAGDWILRSLTVDGTAVSLPDGELEITIQLGEMSGNLGCNSFFGEIDAADDGTLTLGAIGQTEMACLEDGRMEFEAAYGQALGSVTAWAVDPAGMTLSGDTVEIRYEQAPPPVHQRLEGTVWHFDTVYSGEGVERAATNRADMEGVTLVIERGEAVLAGPDCAAVSTVEYADGRDGAFEVTSAVAIDTSPACEIVAIASAGITESTGFMIDENRLTFIGAVGETVGFSARP